jgi:hypothetical protein
VERILILKKRWQAWLDILNLILKAARSYGDRHTEAWVLHQLGTRAMCISYADQARQFLKQALTLREAIGDTAGAAVTRHNLSGLSGIPSPSELKRNGQSHGCGRYIIYGVGFLLFVLFGGSLMFVSALFSPQPTEPPTKLPTRTFIPTIAGTPSPIATPSFTPTFTPTKTLTSTPTNTPTKTTPTNTPSRTPTSTKDTVPPPAPDSLNPRGQQNFGCPPSQVVLEWTASNDPSGISSYSIRLHYRVTQDDNWRAYRLITASGNLTKLDITNDIKDLCNPNRYFRWRIRANDGAGNTSDVSLWRRFRAQPIVD